MPKGNKPATFLQFRKKKDDRKIAETVAKGGTYTTRSRRANNPAGDNELKKGSTVHVENSPGKVSLRRPKFETTPTSKITASQKLVRESLQRPDKGETKPKSKTGLHYGKEADAANARAKGENPKKVATRIATQDKAEADIKAGKTLKTGALTYDAGKGKIEHAGTIVTEKKKTPGLSLKVSKPSFSVEKPSKTISVKEPAKRERIPKGKLPRVPWAVNKEAKRFTKGERRRKKEETGHVQKYKPYKKITYAK